MNSGTIYALSTGAGRAGLAVIRVSGPGAAGALARLAGIAPPAPRRATRIRLACPDSGELLDDALALWFPAPASYTGEDVAELHVHGGPAVIAGLLAALGGCPGLRMAEPGEFTRRAFGNGKLDLTAAEGLADLVAAETAAQRAQALRQLGGELGRLYDSWRERLIGALAHFEAAIDFSDEDLPPGVAEAAGSDVAGLIAEIDQHLDDQRRGERLRDGVRVAIVGPPNSGKSSLLNLLARRDAAIVSEQPGTTRDIIEVHMDFAGYPAVVADTAGLRESTGTVEAEGVRRARRWARDADLRLVVFDQQVWPEVDTHTAELIDGDAVVVVNKIDLGPPAPPLEIQGRPVLAVSVLTGDGIEDLMTALESKVAGRCLGAASPALTRARHRQALEECRDALRRSTTAGAVELAAEDLRLAARALGRITGRVVVEEILDVIFRDFCIGK